MKIGQLAKLTDLNIETIRYYESLNLIPKPRQRDSGYREYDRSYVDKIQYIKKAKELGFTLKEIRELFKFEECHDVREIAERRMKEAEEKVQLYSGLAKRLAKLIKACPNKGNIENCSIIKTISRG